MGRGTGLYVGRGVLGGQGLGAHVLQGGLFEAWQRQAPTQRGLGRVVKVRPGADSSVVSLVVGLWRCGAAVAAVTLRWIVLWPGVGRRLGVALMGAPCLATLLAPHPRLPDDWLTIDVGGKTTVIRLPDGSLFVHAPLLLTVSLKRALAALGPVSVIVVPNTEHVDGAAQWVAAYPDAVALGPPGYAARSGVPLTDIPVDNTPHPAFGGVIEHTFFASMPLFSESVFFHRPSGTLMATDLYWNWPAAGVPARTRFFAAGMDWVYKPVYEALLVRDKDRWAGEEMGRVLAWGGERIIPCHGDVLEGVDVSEVLRAFYASLLRE